MRLTIQDLKDYTFCPHYFKFNNGQYFYSIGVDKHYYESLVRTVKQIYARQLETERKVRWDEVTNKWNKFFWQSKDPSSKEHRVQSNNGFLCLKDYYDKYLERKEYVLAVNCPYHHWAGDHVVSDSIPVLLASEDEVVCLLFDQDINTQMPLYRSIEVQMISVVLKDLFPDKKLKIVNNFYGKGPMKFTESYVYPTDDFVAQSKIMVDIVIRNVGAGLTFSNIYGCKFCPRNNICFE